MRKIILGLAGEMSSGKGMISEYLVKKYQARSCRFSTMLRDLLDRLYLEQNRENIQKISTAIRKNFGEDVMAKVMAEDIKNDKSEVIVIDGVRRTSDITYLKENLDFKLVYIESDLEKRYARLKTRNENAGDGAKSLDDFKKDHQAETELQIKDLKPKADFVVDNNGSVKKFYQQIDEIIEKNKKS